MLLVEETGGPGKNHWPVTSNIHNFMPIIMTSRASRFIFVNCIRDFLSINISSIFSSFWFIKSHSENKFMSHFAFLPELAFFIEGINWVVPPSTILQNWSQSLSHHCVSINVCKQTEQEIQEVSCVRESITGYWHERPLILLIYSRSLYISKYLNINVTYMIN